MFIKKSHILSLLSTLLVLFFVALQSCSKVDDYLLGKDNTPKPKKLEVITPRMDLVKNWSVPVGGAQKSKSYLKMSPSIKGNTVYTASSNGVVKAIEKQSGKTLWSKVLSASIVSGPVVSNGYIAVTTDNSELILLKQIDGSNVWKTRVANEILAQPLITNNKIVVKTIDGNLYAFNLTSGKKIWRSHHGAPDLILKASSRPALLERNTLLTGYSDGKLDAVALDSGQVLWQRSMVSPSGASDVERLVDIDSDPIIQGDNLYFASYQGYVGKLSMSNGQLKWKKPASVFKNITTAGNSVFYTDSNDVVWSLNKDSGAVNWKQAAFKARGLTEPVYSNNKLYIADAMGMLHVLSAQSGKALARSSIGTPVLLAPVVNKSDVFVQASNGTLNKYKVS